MLLYEWSNDPVVRNGSFNPNRISLEEHRQWFEKKLSSKDCYIFIMEADGVSCGLVRFDLDKNKDEAILSYMISSKYRGKRLASAMLNKSICKFVKQQPETTIIAHTIPDNIVSRRSLEKVGFLLTNRSKDRLIYEYIKDTKQIKQ